jgi:hypothetical protein|tara:strand:+ start:293 stop:667 length:375 start_codon:yes stop_codon:yes gene_type:complete
MLGQCFNLMMTKIRLIVCLALLMVWGCVGVAGDDSARRVKAPVAGVVTNYYSINRLNAPCCATMLKHSLTNVAGVKSATIYTTNQVVRVVHHPDRTTTRSIKQAFRGEIAGAKKLKRAPKNLPR